MIKNVIQ